MCWPRRLLNMCLHWATRWTFQGQGYGLSPSHPDLVSIGALAHPMQADPSQQREGHAARSLHHSAEVIMQPTDIDFPFYDYPYYNYYYYYLLLLHDIVSYYSATCASPLPHMTCHHLSSTLYLCSSASMKALVGSRNI